MKKITEKEMYAMIKEAMADNADVVEFCDKKVAALERKAEKARERAAQKRADGDELTEVVKAVLTDEFMTLADIAEGIEGEDITVSKISYGVNKLVKDGVAEKTDVAFETPEGKKVTRKAYRLIG